MSEVSMGVGTACRLLCDRSNRCRHYLIRIDRGRGNMLWQSTENIGGAARGFDNLRRPRKCLFAHLLDALQSGRDGFSRVLRFHQRLTGGCPDLAERPAGDRVHPANFLYIRLAHSKVTSNFRKGKVEQRLKVLQ